MEKPLYAEIRQRLLDFTEESEILLTYYLRSRDSQLQFVADSGLDPETQMGLHSEPVASATTRRTGKRCWLPMHRSMTARAMSTV